MTNEPHSSSDVTHPGTAVAADGSVSAAFATRDGLRACGFFDTALARRLAADPVGVVDIGARWGVSDIFHAAAPLVDAVAFEPDAEEARRIEETERGNGWASFTMWPGAIAAAPGTVTLHLLRRPNNSSIYPVDPHQMARYDLKGFELDRRVDVAASDLDSVAFDGGLLARRAGEVIKMDTQGAEFDIIAGARRVLDERTLCVITEAAFFTPYAGAHLFGDVERELRAHGLQFYGFLDFKHRSTRRHDKRVGLGRERMMQADAVFFRDPCATPAAAAADERSIDVVWLMALLLGYFDFCLELTDLLAVRSPDTDQAERERLRGVVAAVSRADQGAVRTMVGRLLERIDAAPERAAVELGRLVDQQRDGQSYHDVV